MGREFYSSSIRGLGVAQPHLPRWRIKPQPGVSLRITRAFQAFRLDPIFHDCKIAGACGNISMLLRDNVSGAMSGIRTRRGSWPNASR
jgi:hypothetical protein